MEGTRARRGCWGREGKQSHGNPPEQSPWPGTNLSETPLTACSSTFFLSTSLICPFSGPFFTFSRPIR